MKKVPTSILIISTATFLLSVAAWTFSFFWIKTQNQKISILNQNIIDSGKKLEEQNNLERTIEITENERKELGKYFLSSRNVVSFLEEIESYGQISNTKLEIKNVEYDNEGETLKFKITGQGYYSDVYHLLLVLENAPYEFHFNEILFNLGSKEAQSFQNLSNNKSFGSLATVVSNTSNTNEQILKGENITVPVSKNVWDSEFVITLKSFTK
jgi:hypothetical protein